MSPVQHYTRREAIAACVVKVSCGPKVALQEWKEERVLDSLDKPAVRFRGPCHLLNSEKAVFSSVRDAH